MVLSKYLKPDFAIDDKAADLTNNIPASCSEVTPPEHTASKHGENGASAKYIPSAIVKIDKKIFDLIASKNEEDIATENIEKLKLSEDADEVAQSSNLQDFDDYNSDASKPLLVLKLKVIDSTVKQIAKGMPEKEDTLTTQSEENQVSRLEEMASFLTEIMAESRPSSVDKELDYRLFKSTLVVLGENKLWGEQVVQRGELDSEYLNEFFNCVAQDLLKDSVQNSNLEDGIQGVDLKLMPLFSLMDNSPPEKGTPYVLRDSEKIVAFVEVEDDKIPSDDLPVETKGSSTEDALHL